MVKNWSADTGSEKQLMMVNDGCEYHGKHVWQPFNLTVMIHDWSFVTAMKTVIKHSLTINNKLNINHHYYLRKNALGLHQRFGTVPLRGGVGQGRLWR